MNAYGFGKKIKLNRRKVSLNSVLYDKGISFPFGMLQDLILDRNCVFYNETYRNGISFPPLCQQKLLPVYVFTYFAQYMKVACWHNGGGGRGEIGG